MQASLPDNIGKYVARNAKEVERLGWAEFVRRRQGRGDFASLTDVEHPERRLLRQYKHRGAPVVLASGSWTKGERHAVLKRGPYRSATEHTLFLREEFASMIEKGQWVVLPYLVAKGLASWWTGQGLGVAQGADVLLPFRHPRPQAPRAP